MRYVERSEETERPRPNLAEGGRGSVGINNRGAPVIAGIARPGSVPAHIPVG